MKHVVSIKELQQLVPETKSLEGKNFKDMKQLIEFVIREVEKSGKWEYVQYVSGNPSLFVIKEREVMQNVASNKYDMTAEISSHYNPQPAPEVISPTPPPAYPFKKQKVSSAQKESQQPSQPAYVITKTGEKLFEDTKMPW